MMIASLVILGPLAAVIAIGIVRRAPSYIATAGTFVALVAALITLARVDSGDRWSTTLPGLPGLPFLLVIEPMTILLASTVATVAAFVMLYAVGYMGEEREQARFFATLSFFVAAMQTLVLAGDWILFLMAWELIGLASYLLIGFWYERPGVRESATRAFATTRAADFGLYVGAFILIDRAGGSAIADAVGLTGTAITVAGLLLLLAVVGKSAQVPLQGWLQDAMAGPTPVSALLHSATLVVAGVILLLRAFPVLTDDVRLVVGLVGGVTAVVTGIIAVTQSDLKRMLASSTSSQIGFMLLGIGAGVPGAAIFHLVTSAAIKSSLFLGAGVFQHARESTRFDDLAGIGRRLRWTFAAFVLAALSLAGVPPLAAFWSKDAILTGSFKSQDAWLLATLGMTGALLTGVYSARAIRLLWERPEGTAEPHTAAVAGMRWMAAGLGVLVILAATLGAARASIHTFLDVEIPEDLLDAILGLVVTLAGLAIGWQGYRRWLLGPAQEVARGGFRLAGGATTLVVGPTLAIARACDALDQGIHATVLGVGQAARGVSRTMDMLDSAIHRVVVAVGSGSMMTGLATRVVDERWIDGFIRQLVRRTRETGGQARRLQSGLVHREMVIAAGGTILVLLAIMLR